MSDTENKKHMTDEEWTAWVADINEFLADEDLMALSRAAFVKEHGEDNEDEFDEAIDSINTNLTRGNNGSRAHKRGDYKSNIQNYGRDLFGWPKVRGKASNLPNYAVAVFNDLSTIYQEAYTAFWDTLETHGVSHRLMTRPSSRTERDGAPYGTVEAFVSAMVKNEVATMKRQWNAGNFTAEEGAFSITTPVLAPWNTEAETGETDDETDSEA